MNNSSKNIDTNTNNENSDVNGISINQEQEQKFVRRSVATSTGKFRLGRRPTSVRPKKSLAKLKSLRPSFTKPQSSEEV